MPIIALTLVFTMLSVSGGTAQQSAPAAAAVTPKLDTPQARAIVTTLQPRMPSTAVNGHATPSVLIYLDSGSMTRKEGGQTATLTFQRGDVRWRPAGGPDVLENTSDHPIRLLEVDLKKPPDGRAPKSVLYSGSAQFRPVRPCK
jgi:hypothetical protein